ncbi:putative WEB family protein At1g65010, chloroplastic isoform X2 [Chelonus insularis]|uniref:putative WEB family protein At1g65010, chloroplastic isoform X2 n=1 Tax=Chelonus insularis TaxID=460826 RepID=UPI0015887451|nr:putative WEB family protein At1g65010, chloroplastic isoform X2 [Chelonus insularis]
MKSSAMNRRSEDNHKTSSMKNIKSGINEVVKRRSGSVSRESPYKSPNGIVLINDDTTTVEVTVKKKSKKGSPKTSDNKTPDKNPLPDNGRSGGAFQNHHWNKILRDQSISTLKQVLHQTKNPQDLKARSKSENIDDKEIRKSAETKKKSCKSYVNRAEAVIVYDKAVQCGGIFDGTNENFRRLNPVRALAFLMKELEHAIEGEKASNILTEMQQALLRIPIESGQLSHIDMETLAAKARLEASTAQLEATIKTMEESYVSIRKENTTLQQRIQELSSLLKRTKSRENELEAEVEQLRTKLNDALKSDYANKMIINDLKLENKQINELKKELIEGIEEAQHLKLEKEKLTIISSYKDSEFRKLRESIKELQKNVANQLKNFNNFSQDNELLLNPHHHSTMLPKKDKLLARHNINTAAPSSWHDISEVSMSADPFNSSDPSVKLSGEIKHQQIISSDTLEETDNAKFDEKTHLEFGSLADHESSQSSTLSEHHNDDMKSADEVDTSKNNNLSRESRKRKKRVRSRIRKSNDNKSRSSGNKTLVPPEKSSYHESVSSINVIDKNVKEEVQVMFDNVRQKSKCPVSVPSPPHKFPHPDWSDSTLPTISMSESNYA